MKQHPLVEMKNVRVNYGAHEVFEGLTLTLPSDRSSAIIGPNGSGKSTLLKLIFRDHFPVENDDSYFRLLGQKTFERDKMRMKMGLVSHDLQSRVDSESTVLQVVVSQYYSSLTTYRHQDYSKEQLETARHYLDSVDIGHLSSSKYSTISTGEQRRCLLARSLIHDPEYLILDEPTAGLDIRLSHQYMELLSEQIASGKKIVMVTHHLEEILPGIDWLVYLKHGKLIDEGARQDLLTEQKISELFDIPVVLNEENGRVRVNVQPEVKIA